MYIFIIEINKSSFCSLVNSLLSNNTLTFSIKSKQESVVIDIKKYDISTLKYSHNFSNCLKLKFLRPLSKFDICPLLSSNNSAKSSYFNPRLFLNSLTLSPNSEYILKSPS